MPSFFHRKIWYKMKDFVRFQSLLIWNQTFKSINNLSGCITPYTNNFFKDKHLL